MAFILRSRLTFFAGLILIACGTGLLKPNISAMVGQLYSEGDKRRDAGFSIFYMGINLRRHFCLTLVVGFLRRASGFEERHFQLRNGSQFSLALGIWRSGSRNDLWVSCSICGVKNA